MVRLLPATLVSLLTATALLSGAVAAQPAPAVPAPTLSPPTAPPGQGVVISGFRMVQDQGPRRWEIRSREATYDGENSAVLQGVDADLREQEAVTLTVTGSKGRYRSDTRVLALEGKVRAHTLSGYDFSAGAMEWRGADGTVVATGGVTLTRSFLTVKGRSLTHRTDTRTLLMGGGITATWAGGGRE